jgi:hypothetical protein
MIRSSHIRFFQIILTLASVIAGPTPASAGATYTANPDNYLAILKILEPGAYLRLLPGKYENGLPIQYLRGFAQAPITVSGPERGPRAVFVARPGHNTISIINSSYVAIRNLDLDGRHLPVDGVKCEGHADWAHHITLEGLRVLGHGNNQQTVGISTKCPAWGWIIRNNVIKGAGTGLYLGNSNGRAPFIAGLIEHNLVVDTIGYNLQIKHQQSRPILPEIPDEPNATVIRHNVFSKANGGSSRKMARPNVLVGHWPLAGSGAEDRYLVYGNFFYQNPHESLFQGEGNIALYNNLFVNHFGDAIRIQPHNDTARVISVFYNTVIANGSGITLSRREHDPAYPQIVTANMVFASSRIHDAFLESNLTGELNEASDFLALPFAPLGEMNLVPAGGNVHKHSESNMRLGMYPDSGLDFDGDLRGKGGIGAYTPGKVKPRWVPVLEIKPVPVTQ